MRISNLMHGVNAQGLLCPSVAVLSLLRVNDFAIIDKLEVAFAPGLNVVTGETGAGKSILIDALHLVLGARGNPDTIRQGANAAEVEALFEIGDDPDLKQRLEMLGIPADDELIVRRVIQSNGRSRAYVSGKLTTVAQLAELSEGLADIASQHEHHSLANPATHLGYLDGFAKLQALSNQMSEAHRLVNEAHSALAELQERVAQRSQREDLLRFQIQELAALDMQPQDEPGLHEERERLRHTERLMQLTSDAEDVLYSRDDAICDQLARVTAQLEEASRLDRELSDLHEQLAGAGTQLEEIARSLGQYARQVSAQPDRLAVLEQRLERVAHLKRKYGKELADIIAYRAAAEEELAQMQNHEQHLKDLQDKHHELRDNAAAIARELSAKRRAAAQKMGKAITEELRSLGMGDAKVLIEVMRSQKASGVADVDGAALSASGIDRVEFLIAPNRGEQPRPLHKIASGGELSRAMLAIKRVLTGLGPSGVYVFDEVDAGVGGGIAEVIGRKLYEVAQRHQVICITHLPQIAAFAHHHFCVHKGVKSGRTFSDIRVLSAKERQEELARMLGGLTVTPKTRAAAAEMLKVAKRSAVASL